jgi:DNA repair photolyase
MSLKKPKGDMYPFLDWIWNPISGKCQHDCSYCYVKRIANRFHREQAIPHLVKAELKCDLGNDNYIFVCSGCDLFAPDIPSEYIFEVLSRTRRSPRNSYLFQTKNPYRIISSSFGLSTIFHKICTTIETNRWVPEVMRNAPLPILRALSMARLADEGFETMVTAEPIIDFDLDKMLRLIRITKATQVNIGADSGHNHLPEPPKEKIIELIKELEKFTKVIQKKNLGRLVT